MPETDTEKKKEGEEALNDSDDTAEEGVWADDIRKRRYYYDDAHGYEEYDPEDDEKSDE